MQPRTQTLEVWGDFACFSRPEMKVERFSYPVITPSAARAIFDAIYWKKTMDFYWQVEKIELLKPPRYIALRRNEVKDKISSASVAKWMKGTFEPDPIFADGGKDLLGTDQKGRTQRQTMALKNVAYRIYAHAEPRSGGQEALNQIEPQFKRRARSGQCIYQPYLGCREFAAFFRYVEQTEQMSSPADVNLDIGLMLYDVFDLSRTGASTDAPSVSLFDAIILGGVLQVPHYCSDAVLKPGEEARPC
ncbi:MAG: type I-C CRISPR-associated protein Cas5c [Armatimonadota bacterium]|jgi:CRISPR-associated protein Cas5d